MKQIFLMPVLLLIITLTVEAYDDMCFNFEKEKIFVSNSNLTLQVKSEKQKFLNIYLSTVYENVPVAINDIPITGKCSFAIKIQKKNNTPYLFIAKEKKTNWKDDIEQQEQWLFQLSFPKYCKETNPILIENGMTGNTLVILTQPLANNSVFTNIQKIPSITFQLSEEQKENRMTNEKIIDANDSIIYGISNKIELVLKDPVVDPIFKDKKISFEAHLEWDPAKAQPLISYTINNEHSLFYRRNNESSILIWPSPSVPLVEKKTKSVVISVNGTKFLKEKIIFTALYIPINIQYLSGPTLYFIYPIPKQFCSFSPRVGLPIRIIRFLRIQHE